MSAGRGVAGGGVRRMGVTAVLSLSLSIWGGALASPRSASAQYIAPPAAGRAVSPPVGYFERLAQDPAAFTLPNGLFRATAQGPQAVQMVGTKGMLVLPALFSDSPEPHVAPETIGRLLFDGPAPRGTLTEAYLEMSRGKLDVDGTVLPWVRTSLTRAEVVGSNAGLGADAKVGEYLLEALQLADESIDFGQYDNDGADGIPNSGDDDGAVDAMAFEFIEVAGSCGGPGIWPHLWGIAPQNGGQPFLSDDMGAGGSPIRVDAYIIQSAVDCGGVNPQDAATIAHEFGHILGLPDYYHPTAGGGAEGRRWVLGCWELMAAGSWGCGPHGAAREPFGPTHMSARTKNVLGWLDWMTVGAVWDVEVTLPPVSSGQALRIPLDGDGREFLILEYRTRTGFDAQIPADGILIYHQDMMGALRPLPGGDTPYFLSLVEQDHNEGLVRNTYEGGNRGEAGDAWAVGGATQSFHFETTPSLALNADGTSSTVTIHEMRIVDGMARIRLSTGDGPVLQAPSEPWEVEQVEPFERRIRIAGGAMPYQVSASVPEGLTVSAEGDALVVRGAVSEAGPFTLAFDITDARGLTAPPVALPLTAGPWVVEEERLLQLFLGSDATPLSPGEEAFLDFHGNRNGRYDVGDLRAWLRDGTTAGQTRSPGGS